MLHLEVSKTLKTMSVRVKQNLNIFDILFESKMAIYVKSFMKNGEKEKMLTVKNM